MVLALRPQERLQEGIHTQHRKDRVMTQQMKVSVNQWLITAVACVLATWGSYQVVQYKVAENKVNIEKLELCTKEDHDKTTEIQTEVTTIAKALEQNALEHREMRIDIKAILNKVD